MAKKLSKEEKKKHNLELLDKAYDILGELKTEYLIGDINSLTGSVDIDEGIFSIKFKYNKLEGDMTNETTE